MRHGPSLRSPRRCRDAWTVVTVSGAQTAIFRGGPITPDLAVSLTPPATGFPPGSPVDAGMQWLVDFDTALAAGMALKIPLTAQQRASGFDRIFVYGLCDGGERRWQRSCASERQHDAQRATR